MSRLLINLFFIVIICITLAAMPINTEILDMFDFGDLFSKEKPQEETPEKEDEIVTFEPAFTYTLSPSNDKRFYNPTTMTLDLTTNISLDLEANYDYNTLELVLYKNDTIYQTFAFDKFVTNHTKTYVDDLLNVQYTINLGLDHLLLDKTGFYTGVIRSKSDDKQLAYADLAYLTDFSLVAPSATNTYYAYTAYFYNEAKTHTVPLSMNMPYAASPTLDVRNSLYQVPNAESGLALQSVIPNQTSIARLSEGHYGLYMFSNEIEAFMTTEAEAALAIEALTKTMLTMPHINKVSIFVDYVQTQGALFNIDLTKVYEASTQAQVYLPQLTSNNKAYLLPVALSAQDVNGAIFEIIDTLKHDTVEGQNFLQVLPPEVELNTILLEGTNITLDFNGAFLEVYPSFEAKQSLMIHSLLYSVTSLETIETMSITIDGSPLTNYGGFDFTSPLVPLEFINYIGQF